jgi:putative tributyrin esterase
MTRAYDPAVRSRSVARVVAGLVAGLVLLTACGGGDDAPAAPEPRVRDELPAALDNGAAGRNTFNRPDDVPPSRACADRLRPTKRSTVLRVLVDGPRAPDGTLAFTSGVCVYLPPGYADSGLRYPVLYFLHGGGGDAADPVAEGRLRETMDEIATEDPRDAAIVVMPDGANGQWYDSVDGTIRNEEYVTDAVVDYVDRSFRTIAARDGRAVVGVSNGGFGALLFAAKHPDRFAAAGGMSSNLDGLTLFGLGPFEGEHYRANHPLDLVQGLRRTPVVLDIATRCTDPDPAARCGTQTVDQAFVPANRALAAALREQPGRDAPLDYAEVDGAHQWSSWTPQLRTHQLPFLVRHLRDPHR